MKRIKHDGTASLFKPEQLEQSGSPAAPAPLKDRSSRLATMVAFPFGKRPDESASAFAAFKTYLKLGPHRSLPAVALELGKRPRLVEKWAARFDWPARVAVCAAHLAELERLAIEAAAIEEPVAWEKTHEGIRRELWQEAEATLDLVRKARARWEASDKVPGFEAMARLLELAFKMKRFAAGMPGENEESHTMVTGKVSMEWEAAIRKAYGQAESGADSPEANPPTVVDVEEVKP
jgi:hypothetical protein